MPDLTEADLTVGATYRAKRPARIGRTLGNPDGEWNDRTIIWRGIAEVQYDGPAVPFGAKYPRVTFAAFLKWAGQKLPA